MGAMNIITEKVLGIDVHERYAHEPAGLDRRAYEIIQPADIYLEQEPSVSECLKDLIPDREDVGNYIVSLFPSATWIARYKGAWLLGDIVAGSYIPARGLHTMRQC